MLVALQGAFNTSTIKVCPEQATYQILALTAV